MARPAKIWLRKQTGWYCVTLKGDIVKLSKDKKEAEKLFHQLMANKEDDEPATQFGPSFRKLADEFLKATSGDKQERTVKLQTSVLQLFCNFVKKTRAADLKGHMVTKWLAHENEKRVKQERKVWNGSTQSFAIRTVKAVLNWGVKQNHLKENPIKRLPGGKVARRERIVTLEERDRIRKLAKPNFRDYFTVCELTGARPYSEIAKLEAKDIDFDNTSATLKNHKTAKKTGKPRVIFFVPEALAILKRLAEKYPTGLLFRTKRASAWNRSNAMKWAALVKKKLDIDFNMYCLRHTFITNALLRGVPVEVVAALVGNTAEIIHKHYSHVGKDQTALKAAALKAVG